jgi:hypothetical protein
VNVPPLFGTGHDLNSNSRNNRTAGCKTIRNGALFRFTTRASSPWKKAMHIYDELWLLPCELSPYENWARKCKAAAARDGQARGTNRRRFVVKTRGNVREVKAPRYSQPAHASTPGFSLHNDRYTLVTYKPHFKTIFQLPRDRHRSFSLTVTHTRAVLSRSTGRS